MGQVVGTLLKKLKYLILNFYPVWVFGIILALDGYLTGHEEEKIMDDYLSYLPYLLMVTSPLTVPGIILMINYFFYTSGSRKTVLKNEKEILVNSKLYAINRCILHKVSKDKLNLFNFLPWQEFYYIEFVTTKGSFYKSCFGQELENLNPDEIIESKFPFIK